MTTWALRTVYVLGGAFLFYANIMGGAPGTFLGFYPLDTAERVGYDVGKAAIATLALWIIYRGIRPKAAGIATK